jgi:hypothetical protein
MLRVMFVTFEDDMNKREAVCYLRPTDNGQIDILYSHHTDYTRPGPVGQWEPPVIFKMALSPSLISEISANVMYEFWNAFGHRVSDLPQGTGVPAPEKQYGSDGVKFNG